MSNSPISLRGMRIGYDPNVSDYDQVERTWVERLFTLPWNPFLKYKVVYAPKAYMMNDSNLVVVSPATYSILLNDQRALNKLPMFGEDGDF